MGTATVKILKRCVVKKVVLHNKKKVKVGRPKEVQGVLKPQVFYLEDSRVREFKELCAENGVSISEGMRQLIDHELEQTATTTIGVAYGRDGDEIVNKNNLVNVNSDHWMTDEEAMNKVDSIEECNYNKAFSAFRKMIQRLDFKMNGKYTSISTR